MTEKKPAPEPVAQETLAARLALAVAFAQSRRVAVDLAWCSEVAPCCIKLARDLGFP